VKSYLMYVATISVLLFATLANASQIFSILQFNATSPVTYSPGGTYIVGDGSGTLTAAAGSLPIGTAVNFSLTTFIYPQSATVNGTVVTQDYIAEPGLYVTLAADGSNVLTGFGVGAGFTDGVLGSSSATVEFPVSGLSSSYITNLPNTAHIFLIGTTSVPLSLNYSLCPSVCPSISSFDLDWNFSASSSQSSAPEPSSVLLLGGGLLTAALRRWTTGRNR